MTRALQQDEWEKTIGNHVTRFEYASKKKPISVSPLELKGPGWSAKIEGNCKVSDHCLAQVAMIITCCVCTHCLSVCFMLGYLLLLIAQVEFKDALLPKANSKSEIKEAISSGLSPPCILYKVFYSFPVEQRVKPAELTVALHGEDLELRFNCEIMEGMCECIC